MEALLLSPEPSPASRTENCTRFHRNFNYFQKLVLALNAFFNIYCAIHHREVHSEAVLGHDSIILASVYLVMVRADIWLLNKIQICLRPKIPTKNLHEWGFGEADRAEF